jgi:hypothetical protein
MDNGLEVRVVEVEDVGADPVEERGVKDVEPVLPSENRGRTRTGKLREPA